MAQDGKKKQQQQHQQQNGGKKQVQQQQQHQPPPPLPPVATTTSGGGSSKKTAAAKGGLSAPLTAWDRFVGGILFVAALVLVLGTTHLASKGQLLVLQPRDRKAALDSVSASFAGKLEFAAKYWILGLVWLYFHLHVVIMGRVTSAAANPLAGHEDRVQADKNVFGNSVEQFVLAIVSQAAALPYLTGSQVLQLIPLFNGLFLVGRLLFWLGYPRRRSFGFTTSMLPSTIAIFFATYKFATTHLDVSSLPDSLFRLRLE